MDKSWDGRFSNLQVSSTAHPELYHELKSIKGRARGERFRMLATLGLQAMKRESFSVIGQHGTISIVEHATNPEQLDTDHKTIREGAHRAHDVDSLRNKRDKLKNRVINQFSQK